MPTVPLPTGPSVEQRALPTPYQNNQTYDAGPGIQRAAGKFGQLAEASADFAASEVEKAKKQAEATKTREDLTTLEKQGTDSFYGTPAPTPGQAADGAFNGYDPKQGYLSLKGKTALDAGPDVYKRLEETRDQLAEGYTDPAAKERFLQQSEGLLRQYYGRVESHAAQQRDQAGLDSLKDAEDQAIRRAALDPNDSIAATNDVARIVGAQDQIVTSPGNALARADAVQERITTQRLDSLLAQPGGFTDAERVLNENKRVLGKRLDDYEKRIEAAKLGGTAAVLGERIALESMTSNKPFAPPDEAKADELLSKLDPTLQKAVAPVMKARIAMKKQAITEAKKAFVDAAVTAFNNNEAAFFQSDIAHRLNQVDPDKYGALRDKLDAKYDRMRRHAHESQSLLSANDKGAMLDYKAYGDGDLALRSDLNLDTFLADYDLSPNGAKAIRAAQAGDKAHQAKGLGEGEGSFVRDVKAKLQKFAPPRGTTPASRAASAQWWAEKNADAVNAYSTWVDNNPGKKPTPADINKLNAEVIAGVRPNPKNPASIEAAGNAIAVQGGGGKPVRTGKKKLFKGITYYELSDGSSETD